MRIITNELPVVFATLFAVKASELTVKMRDDQPNLSPDGRKVYRTPVKALQVDEHGVPSREERDVNLGIIEPTDINPGMNYKAAGKIWVTHYTTNANRMGVSIVAEKLVPVLGTKNDDK